MAVAIAAAIGLSSPTQADPDKKFEATLLLPGLVAAEEGPGMVCPEPDDSDGTFWKFFDLEGEYKHLKVSGPAHLFNEPNPVGVHAINDYDVDLYAFDNKCKDITPSKAAPDAGTEIIETRRPARYAVVTYWSGIHPELPITLEVSHTKIK